MNKWEILFTAMFGGGFLGYLGVCCIQFWSTLWCWLMEDRR